MSSLPWVQVERDFLSVRAPEIAGELGIPVPHAAGLMLMLWSWCQARGSGELTGRNWRRSVEVAAGWDGEPGEFVAAIIASGLVEDRGDAGRVKGLDRYDKARAKAAADRKRIAEKRALGRESQAHDRRTSVAATSQRQSKDGPATVCATSPGRDVRRQITSVPVGTDVDAREGAPPAAGELELDVQGGASPKPRRLSPAADLVAWAHADRAQRLGPDCPRPDAPGKGVWPKLAELLRDHGRKTAEAAWAAFCSDPGAIERGLPVALFASQWARWVSEAQRARGIPGRSDVRRGAVRAEDMAQVHRELPVGIVEDW